nr:hypothetical protein GCM10020092_080130 [Actinoplanes digitatis]
MTGYWSCLVLSLRTARLQVIGWPLLVAALVASTASTLADTYPRQADRDAYAAASEAMQASAALQGRGGGI